MFNNKNTVAELSNKKQSERESTSARRLKTVPRRYKSKKLSVRESRQTCENGKSMRSLRRRSVVPARAIIRAEARPAATGRFSY